MKVEFGLEPLQARQQYRSLRLELGDADPAGPYLVRQAELAQTARRWRDKRLGRPGAGGAGGSERRPTPERCAWTLRNRGLHYVSPRDLEQSVRLDDVVPAGRPHRSVGLEIGRPDRPTPARVRRRLRRRGAWRACR